MPVQSFEPICLHQIAFDRAGRILPMLQRQELINQFLQITHQQSKCGRRIIAFRKDTCNKRSFVLECFRIQQSLVQSDYILALIEKGEFKN